MLLFGYLFIGVYWTAHAMSMQLRHYGRSWLLVPCFIGNLLLWPIGIFFAIRWYYRR